MLVQCFVPYGQHTLVLVAGPLDFSPINNQNQVQFFRTLGFQQKLVQERKARLHTISG